MAIGTAAAIAIGIGGSTILGGIMGNDAQRSASNKAADAQAAGIDTQMQMFNRSMEQFKPFYEVGVQNINNLQHVPAGAEAPILPSATNFEFDPESKSYKLATEDFTKKMNQQFAARGMYNSRPALNALSEGYRRLGAAEEEKQYNRQYAAGMDKFNIENQLAQQTTAKYQDLVKLGAGAASSMGQNALNTGQGISSAQTNMSNIALQQGQNQAGMWQDIGSAPFNALVGNYYGKKAGLW